MFFIGLLLGLFIGAAVGLFTAALLAVDRDEEGG